MNARERFLKTLSFEKVDRIPLMDFGYWEEVVEEWHSQGLQESIRTDAEVENYFGLDKGFEVCQISCVFLGMIPEFEPVILEDDGVTVLAIDGSGTKLMYKKKYGTIPKYIEFPVKTQKDFDDMKFRWNGRDPSRFPADWDKLAEGWNKSEEPVGFFINGFFGHPRGLMGLEELSVAFYDQPELVHDINRHHLQLNKDILDKVLKDVKIDYLLIWEDMAYKNGSLISPELFREFMTPYYREIVAYARERGVKKILVDCDGNVLDLTALFAEAGVDGIYPCEIASGSEPAKLRELYPNLALIGGIDKRVLEAGKDAIDLELSKIPSLLEKGGFIPAIDHRVQSRVTLDNYAYYVSRKREIIEEFYGLR